MRLSLGLFLLAALTAESAFAIQGNMVKNGNFERRLYNGAIPDWTFSCPTAPALSTTAKFDSNSLQLNDNSTTAGCSATSNQFVVDPGFSLAVEAWAKWTSTPGVPSRPTIFVVWYDYSGVEITRQSVSVPGNEGVWNKFRNVWTVPDTAKYARLILNSYKASSQLMQFDGVYAGYEEAPYPGEVNRYVAPTALGTGSGTSAANAAKYNSSTFWNGVKTQLVSSAVRVIFLTGKYDIKSSSDVLTLTNIGNTAPEKKLILIGEESYGTRFVASSLATTTLPHLIRIQDSRNILVANLHFRTESPLESSYLFLINNTNGMAIYNISTVNTTLVTYGAMGIHEGSSNITTFFSEFLRLGYDSHQHFLYAYRNVSNITLYANTYEDSTGAYVRCRDRCTGFYVTESDFRATGTWGSSSYRYQHFIEFALFNDRLYQTAADAGQQEWFLETPSALGNRFSYASAQGNAIPVAIHHSGFKPWDGVQFRNHLLTAADADTLLYGTTTAKRALLQTKFFINPGQYSLSANTYENILYRVQLESTAAYGASTYYPSEDWAGSGTYDISSLFVP